MTSHLFAWLGRMKFIRRWGLMHNTWPENIQEHSLRVAMVAHTLALIRNRSHGGKVSPERAATLALYHDVAEVLTGDLPAPVKYTNPAIRDAYREIEASAAEKLLELVPAALRADYRPLFFPEDADREHWVLVHAADKICAWIKCLEEVSAGNHEFTRAEKALRETVEGLGLPEVHEFVETFSPGFRLTLDELG
ncbi:MAG: 5'-deoxynucleotidase [Candidatus Rokubacteria bacterium]|nr:5'-deoxynucleotidase [Candidatus Rokubacteria bacterium]MBI3827185.1 5'-deoxynucleotidase [Candidatus Rokubacteria bacterium]